MFGWKKQSMCKSCVFFVLLFFYSTLVDAYRLPASLVQSGQPDEYRWKELVVTPRNVCRGIRENEMDLYVQEIRTEFVFNTTIATFEKYSWGEGIESYSAPFGLFLMSAFQPEVLCVDFDISGYRSFDPYIYSSSSDGYSEELGLIALESEATYSNDFSGPKVKVEIKYWTESNISVRLEYMDLSGEWVTIRTASLPTRPYSGFIFGISQQAISQSAYIEAVLPYPTIARAVVYGADLGENSVYVKELSLVTQDCVPDLVTLLCL